jgi:hypothetical protein
MAFNRKIVKALFLFTVSLFVVSCTAAPNAAATYTSNSGAVVYLDNDRESCVRSCNADFDRCGDTRAAQAPVGRGQMTGILGGAADCNAALRTCLGACKGR